VPRVKKSELDELRRAVVCGRRAVEAARGELIEALGDWICGSDSVPPGRKEMEALARLSQAQECIEAEYARCIQRLSQQVIDRFRGL
jgi:hypothetical protein